ncbi:MAG: FxsA family protein [Hyphomicrobiaceae bacterium]
MIGLIILIALPLIEIAVLIKAGQEFGFWPVLGLVVATFVLGSAILTRVGFSSALKVREALARGEPPVGAMLDSAMVVVAAFLLITPGLIADAVGLALLIPPVRHAIARYALRNAVILGSVTTEQERYEERHDGRAGHRPPRDRPSDTDNEGPVIEGEFERLDERPLERGRGRGPDERR